MLYLSVVVDQYVAICMMLRRSAISAWLLSSTLTAAAQQQQQQHECTAALEVLAVHWGVTCSTIIQHTASLMQACISLGSTQRHYELADLDNSSSVSDAC
jgi:hypothetical protein